jgi:Nitroreductase family
MVMDIYAAMADGVWLYEPKAHKLLPHLRTDIRAETGTQDFVAKAPLNLVYVAHGERMGDISAEDRRLYASVDTDFIGQNVYLFCAAEGLASVFRAAMDYASVARTMELGTGQFVTFAQSVGYPSASRSMSRAVSGLQSADISADDIRLMAGWRAASRVHRIGRSSIGVVEAKHSCPVIIASPIDCSTQGLLGGALVQVILLLELEPRSRCAMVLALIEDMADVNGERHEPDQMLSEEALALPRCCSARRRDPQWSA